jgi:hypothetical protein
MHAPPADKASSEVEGENRCSPGVTRVLHRNPTVGICPSPIRHRGYVTYRKLSR